MAWSLTVVSLIVAGSLYLFARPPKLKEVSVGTIGDGVDGRPLETN